MSCRIQPSCSLQQVKSRTPGPTRATRTSKIFHPSQQSLGWYYRLKCENYGDFGHIHSPNPFPVGRSERPRTYCTTYLRQGPTLPPNLALRDPQSMYNLSCYASPPCPAVCGYWVQGGGGVKQNSCMPVSCCAMSQGLSLKSYLYPPLGLAGLELTCIMRKT